MDYIVQPQDPVVNYMRTLGLFLESCLYMELTPKERLYSFQNGNQSYVSVAKEWSEAGQIGSSRELFEITNKNGTLVVRSPTLTNEEIDQAVRNVQALLKGEQEPTRTSVGQVH